ncbi:MAG: hypothetical protein GY883_18360 [Shimia sp.]|nr:hypothetical protein [Shimia sp.]
MADTKAFRALEYPLRKNLRPEDRGNHLLHGIPVHHLKLLGVPAKTYGDSAGAYRMASPRSNGIDTRLENAIWKNQSTGEMPRKRAFKHPDEAVFRRPEDQWPEKLRAMKYHAYCAMDNDKALIRNPKVSDYLKATYDGVHANGLALNSTFESPARPPPGAMDGGVGGNLPQPRTQRCRLFPKVLGAGAGGFVLFKAFVFAPIGASLAALAACLAMRPRRTNGAPNGKTFYKGGTFVPGGGRAPKGGGFY